MCNNKHTNSLMSVQIRFCYWVSFCKLMKSLSVFREFWFLEESIGDCWLLSDMSWPYVKAYKNCNVRICSFLSTFDPPLSEIVNVCGMNEWEKASLKKREQPVLHCFYWPPGGSNKSAHNSHIVRTCGIGDIPMAILRKRNLYMFVAETSQDLCGPVTICNRINLETYLFKCHSKVE